MTQDETGGWCAPPYEEVMGWPLPELPPVSIKRRGIRYMNPPVNFRIVRHGWFAWELQADCNGQTMMFGRFASRRRADEARTLAYSNMWRLYMLFIDAHEARNPK